MTKPNPYKDKLKEKFEERFVDKDVPQYGACNEIEGYFDSINPNASPDELWDFILKEAIPMAEKKIKKQIKEQLDKEYDGLYNTWEHRSVNWCYRVFKHILK